MDPTADIKETFIAESLTDAFHKFEESLAERSKQQSGVKLTPGMLASNHAHCAYRLDTKPNGSAVIAVFASTEQPTLQETYTFIADTIGTGILNMRLVWRYEGGQLLNSDELAEFCVNELDDLTPVA